VALVVTLVGLSACGTTVGRRQSADASGLGQGLGEGVGGGTGSGGMGPSAISGSLGASGGSAAGTGVSATPGALATGESGGGVSGPSTTGVSGGGLPSVSIPPGGTIELGIATYSDPSAVGESGFEGAPDFNGIQTFGAMVSYFNAHGGFGGHQVDPIYYQFPLASTTAYATEEQGACADFTQDHHVLAAITDRPSFDDVLTSCLGAAHVPLITDTFGYLSQSDLTNYPVYFPSEATGQRVSRNWVTGLQREGYFAATARVGLVYCDFPTFDAVLPSLQAAISAAGVHLAATSEITCGSDGDVAPQIAASVLKFKSVGVDHVLLMDEGPVLTLLWPIEADSQGYAPRYGLNTFNTPAFVSGNVPAAEFHGAIGVGWWPWEDVGPGQWPAPDAPASLCITVLTQAGLQVNSAGGRAASLWDCGMLEFFRSVAAVAPTLSLSGIASAVNGFGTSWVSPNTFRTQLGPSRHDGAAAYRDFAYADGCACFQYTSPTLYPM